VESLKQFKNFKETCIQSDKYLRDGTSETTGDNEDGLLVELPKAPSTSKRTRTPKIKAETVSQKIKEPSKKPKKKEQAMNIKKEVDSSNELDNLYEVTSTKTKKTKKKKPRQKRNGLADVQIKQENESEESDSWNEPLKTSVVKTTESSGKIKQQQLYRCTVRKCIKKFRSKALLETHLKSHEGVDVIFLSYRFRRNFR
jgi:hypothetical protein